MTEYYYSTQPTAAHDEQTFSFSLLGSNLRFITDSGVFSRRTVDYGSRTLLTALEQAEITPRKVLDVGCGYGPLGIALARRFSASRVTMSDVNERALALARRNAAANHVKNVMICQSDGYAMLSATDYDLVVTNPPVRAGKKVVHEILAGAFDHLVSGGALYVVLQKKQGAPSAKKLMETTFGNCQVVLKQKGYYVLRSER
ncbi:class I SAM-dependent methyltransferase [Ligilactobacillus sp. LYQ60]|uniref:class I SAM-dependent methyltransferase n=1 Tax=unclassified Ligilactobacillus TaxID=2767920 RepID=UPI0038538D03